MNYLLYGNHTISKDRLKDKEIIRKIDQSQYLLVDISTYFKGPLYTLVKSKKFHPVFNYKKSNLMECTITLELSYSGIDCPVDDTMQVTRVIPIRTISNQYCIYPLINELYHFNSFKDNHELTENLINIDEIHYKDPHSKWHINPDSSSMKNIKKIFKENHLYTNGDIMKDNYLIVTKGEYWKFINTMKDADPGDIQCIYIPVTPQSFYRLTDFELILFQSIQTLSIQIYDFTDSEMANISNYNEIDLYQDIPPYEIIEVSNLNDILLTCLYFPQDLLLENKVYEKYTGLKISITTNKNHLNLMITNQEARKGFSLFYIIKNLLSM